MSELTDSLRAHGQRHLGTDLGGLLQWAALHIDAQDEALEEVRAEYAQEESARKRLESALHSAMQATESAAQALMDAPSMQTRSAFCLQRWSDHRRTQTSITHGKTRIGRDREQKP